MSNNIKGYTASIATLCIALFMANRFYTAKQFIICICMLTGCVVLLSCVLKVYLLFERKQWLRKLDRAIRDSEHKGDGEIGLLFTEYILVNEYRGEEIEGKRTMVYMVIKRLNKEYNLVSLATMYIDGVETLPQLIQRSLMINQSIE